jgi:hypothetical protein
MPAPLKIIMDLGDRLQPGLKTGARIKGAEALTKVKESKGL